MTTLQTIKIDELEALHICSQNFNAKILLQGGQLMEFATAKNPTNWLWASANVEYKKNQAVRGGVPICFPLFGNYADNAKAVQATFYTGLPKHGVARTALWTLKAYDLSEIQTTVTLDWQPPQNFVAQYPLIKLQASLIFEFNQQGFSISLVSQNLGEQTIYFSQAFHTYLPTDDIHRTRIQGFDNSAYVDMLQNKSQAVEQIGDISFEQEVDRIYQSSPEIILNTPSYQATLTAKNSLSTIIWNPWIEKSKTLDQFLPTDFKTMLCIETANAGQDFVTLTPNASHTLALKFEKKFILA